MTDLEKYFTNYQNIASPQVAGMTPEEFIDAVEPAQENWIPIFKKIHCKDGFSMSVQASHSHYCFPRITIYSKHSFYYSKMEVGFPSEVEELLLPFAENKEKPTETVYPYVPVTIIEQVIQKHGGIQF